jgi:hypothetical protein
MREYLNLALTVTCGACWTLAYIFIIIRSFRDKTYGMPFWALSFNICWEFIFSTLLSDHGQPTQLLFNRIWVILDVFILFAYFKYGIREWPKKLSVIFFYPYSIMVLVISFGFIYFLSRELHDTSGRYIAYIQNLMMSMLFINMLNNRQGLAGQSLGIALLKMIGTLSATILFIFYRSKFVVFAGSLCFFFDLIYFVMVLNHGRLVWPFPLKLRSKESVYVEDRPSFGHRYASDARYDRSHVDG